MMKKGLMVLLALMIAVTLIGCQGGGAAPTPGGSTEGTESGATPGNTDATPEPADTATEAPADGTKAPAPEAAWDDEIWEIGDGWMEETDGSMYADGSAQLARIQTWDMLSVKSVTVEFQYESMTNVGFPDGNFGIGFITSSGELYFFNIWLIEITARIQYYNTLSAGGENLQTTTEISIEDDAWHTMKVNVGETTLEMYIDDALIGTAEGSFGDAFTEATIMLQSYNALLSFRNVTIETAEAAA